MSLLEKNNPFDELSVLANINHPSNIPSDELNNEESKVETVNSTSQVSPIQQSESIMDQLWS